jgi:trk system potassium uptake protein TrkH
VILLGYISIIIIGTILLSLPISTHSPHSLIDNIFTSTSGICVTGLIVKDTPTDFTRFGKAVILLLIQIGGLGYMTIASLLFIILRRKLSLRQSTVTEETLVYPFGGIRRFVIRVIEVTIGLEALGCIILTWRFMEMGMDFSEALCYGIFHSVSAFCNAGFALFSQSLVPFVKDKWVILTMGVLIILGGIGFIVLREIYERIRKMRKDFSLHTKLVFISTSLLLIIGIVGVFIAEWNGVLKNLSLVDKICASFFQSITPRTAGFQVANVGEYKLGTKMLTLVFMFIGASPGGTGGGIKTTTAVLILMSIYAYFRGKKEVSGLGRSVGNIFITRAFVIAGVSGIILILSVLVLSFSESDQNFMALLFEEISAFGTVGLSVGSKLNPACSLSYEFTNIGKIVIILTMLFGRVGSLTIGAAFVQKAKRETIRLPKGIILTG